ncbi:hypothetical protein DID88_000234 [Monilinia fructigena]|uniref:Uncharacterized protein n=1 Tax=Monilinia fructigena TaxID=38457 RepID=A0A395IQ42_9HELO|nr:hypothetical protein DID88_000234 [Monilinia fructigena]
MKYETPDDLDIYHEEYLQGAMEVIGGLLGEIQYELERLLNDDFKAIRNPVNFHPVPDITSWRFHRSEFDIISWTALLMIYLQDEYDAYGEEKEDARIKYEELKSNYKKLRDQLEALIRARAQVPDNDAPNQAELRLYRANSRFDN